MDSFDAPSQQEIDGQTLLSYAAVVREQHPTARLSEIADMLYQEELLTQSLDRNGDLQVA